MSCNCKNGQSGQSMNEMLNKESRPINLVQNLFKYTLKTLAFILMVIVLPIINLFIIWFLFNTLVLNKNIDIKPLLLAIGNKFKEKEEEDIDEEELYSLTEDDVTMLDVEDITNK